MLLGARQFFERRGAPTPPLPYDAEVEWLESTGTQWINTGVMPTSDVGTQMGFLITGNIGSDSCMIMAGSDSWRWGFGYRFDGGYLQISGLCKSGPSWTNYSVSIAYHDISYNFANDKRCYLDGNLLRDEIPYGDVVSPGPIWLFTSNYNGDGTSWRPSVMRVYYCKMIDNGVLVRDFIPVRKNGVGYMYDKVSGNLLGNSGTGDFVIGPDK